ncbi:MAG: FtsQ-type POTRA domain-containing protein [Rhodospirillaceae bacterium]|jgi:cell division protein FtsQ|nr:FtsQ-type POTRA domain-containing protein [Rhodospirillaceae bacterium]MBT4426074.1 FtsQ-type POTRA domain-containing protein [Rhodospirillaceae bacterium]MBT5039846.1 FtsQ-type POTRA domain-containing protein [Rhodospirillaceae bacterium]MBT5674804.1 FtsQ-type POTRA domain-containing protein [Rhodospirillaceae bacterium]MBT5778473.1 FtsQ-type POTRA domain-containing protein [Rhodospirillaceae bacterium]
MRQLSFNDHLTPERGAAAQRPPRRARVLWLRAIRQRARLLAVTGAVGALVLAGGWWLSQPGTSALLSASVRQTVIETSASLGMTVENVYSVGHHEATPEAILTALEIARGDPILAFTPAEARRRILALDWVEGVTIERRLPDTIRVNIVERSPFALWQHDKRIQLVDRGGTIINAADVPRFAHLPLIVGDGAVANAPALFDTMRAEPKIFRSLVSAVWVGARRWDLHFDSGLIVRFPESVMAAAWHRLVDLFASYDMNRERIVSIDLRLPDRAAFGLRPNEVLDGSAT